MTCQPGSASRAGCSTATLRGRRPRALSATTSQPGNPDGQQWTTPSDLAVDHATELREEEPDLVGIGVEPSVGIGQRALLVRTPEGNVLGGIDTICMSHPHFFGAHVDVADFFDARVLIPRVDARWVQRPSSRVSLFDDVVDVLPGVTLARIGGHFVGAAVLHWAAGSSGAGALLTGDTINVVADREWVSFMWSFPNLIPLDEATVARIAAQVEPFAFERWWGTSWCATAPRPCAARPTGTSLACAANACSNFAHRSVIFLHPQRHDASPRRRSAAPLDLNRRDRSRDRVQLNAIPGVLRPAIGGTTVTLVERKQRTIWRRFRRSDLTGVASYSGPPTTEEVESSAPN